MKKLPWVFTLGVLLLVATCSYATMTPEKAAYMEAVNQAKAIYESGGNLSVNQVALLKQEGIIRDHRNELDIQGGPDEFGYSFVDSNEPGGPVYEWVDISETGTSVTNWSDDTNVGPFNIGFDFPFYGVSYSQIWVCSNGWITFSDGQDDEYTNTEIPDDDIPNNAIYWCWDDWRPDPGNSAWYGLDEDGNFVFQFAWPDDDYAGVNDSEIVLYPDGTIKIQYGENFTVRNNNITIGLENADATIALQAMYNDNVGYPQPEMAIQFELMDMGTVAGRVFNNETQEGIGGAEVVLLVDDAFFRSTFADQEGNYSMMVEIGNYNILASAFGYVDSEPVPVEVIVDDEVTVDIGLDPAPAPEITVDPEALNFTCAWMGTDSDILTVTNTGGYNLDWSVSIVYVEDMLDFNFVQPQAKPFPEPYQIPLDLVMPTQEELQQVPEKKAEYYNDVKSAYGALKNNIPLKENQRNILESEGIVPSRNELDNAGTDEFGYIFTDSEEADCPDFDWIDISETGELVEGLTDDNSVGPFELPFEFPFYDNVYSEIFLGSNGILTFGEGSSDLSNDAMPHANTPNNLIAFFWDDLNVDDHGWAYVGEDPDGNWVCQLVEYEEYSGNSGRITCETILYPNGAIKIQYLDLALGIDIDGETIGIENADATIGLQASLNTEPENYPYNELVVLFHLGEYTGGWLEPDPSNGVIVPGDDQEIIVTADASRGSLDAGNYEAIMTFTADYPNVDPVSVWATLTVMPPGMIEGNITDSQTGSVLPFAEIRVWGLNEDPYVPYYADENGFYSFPIGDGDHTLTAIATDYYESEEAVVNVVEGVVSNQDFALMHHIPPEITIDPAFFQWEVDWLGNTQDFMTIGNIGGLDLNYNIGVSYIAEEDLATTEFRNRISEIRANYSRPVAANTIVWDGPSSHDEAGTTPEKSVARYSELDDPYFLVIQDNDPWGGNITHQDALNEFEIPFDVVGSAVMPTHDLDDYTVIMIPSCQSQDFYNTFAANYDRFSDWVSNGGWFEFHGCTQGADWTFWNDVTYVHVSDQNNYVVEPDHPICMNIPEEFTGNSANHGYMENVPDNATVLIVDSNERPVLIETAWGGGNLLIGTETLEWGANQDPRQGAGEVMRNMILYAAEFGGTGSWLRCEPNSGVIVPDATEQIDLFVDAAPSELAPGTYEAIITVEGDHPDTEPVSIWATLIVGSPGIVEGRVTDAASGEGLFEAEVIIWDENGAYFRSVFTDENGNFTMLIGEGTWDISAHIADYYDSNVEQIVAVNGEITVQNFELDHHIPPTIDVDREYIRFISPPMSSDTEELMISNNGGLPLNYDIGFEYIDDVAIAQRILETGSIYPPRNNKELDAVKEVEVSFPTNAELAEVSPEKVRYYKELEDAYECAKSGKTLTPEKRELLDKEGLVRPLNELDNAGMDEFGYYFTDSSEDDCPDFEWVDISETGELIEGLSDDNSVGPFELPFEFPFYDNVYTEIYLGSNGILTFGEGSSDLSNDAIPHANTPNNVIAFFWDDLNVDDHGWAYTGLDNDGNWVCQLVEYEEYSGNSGRITCETILYPNGAIKIQYLDLALGIDIDGETIGIENADATIGLQASLNAEPANYPYNELVVLFHLGDYTGDSWLSADPDEGTIEIGEDHIVNITADAESIELPEGIYEGMIEIEADHPDTPPTIVWAEYIVGAGGIFHPVVPTGLPYPIVIEEVMLNGVPVGPDAGIGVYDGDMCVGAFTTTDVWPRSLVAWGGNEERGLPGYTPGNPMTFKVWNEGLDEMLTAYPTYTEGDGNFGTMPYAVLSLNAAQVPTLNLRLQGNYFELISFSVVPEVIDADVIFNTIENFAIAYESSGDIYLPPDLNFIGEIDFSQGYRVFCYENSSLTVQGEILDPNTQFTVEGGIWNWIGYPFYHQVPVEVALSNMADNINIVLADDGRLWIPGIINNMGNMLPGEGYMLFPTNDMQFTYVDNAVANVGATEEQVVMPMIEGKPASTGMPYAIVVNFSDDALALEPATIEIYDGSTLVGKEGVLEDSPTPVIAWQGNSDYNISGFTPGNNMSIVVRAADGTKLPLVSDGNKPAFGEDAFANLTLKVVEMPTEFAVEQGYPNPFNPTVTVPFAIPAKGDVAFTVFNVLGQEVFHSSQSFDAGFHRFMFDANGSGSELVSGMYFLKVDYQGQANTQKLMLLK